VGPATGQCGETLFLGFYYTLLSGFIVLIVVFKKGFFLFLMWPVNKVPKKNKIQKIKGTDRRLAKLENLFFAIKTNMAKL